MQEIKKMKEELQEKYEIRKTNKQKTRFIEYIKEIAQTQGYDVNIEESKGLIKSRNIVVGDVDKANIIYTAHYDTCAWSPFPNMIWLKAPHMYLLYQVFITFFVLLFGFAISLIVAFVTKTSAYTHIVFEAAIILLAFQLMFGFRNKHTANDNTSGVLTLLAIMEKMTEEERTNVAFVFFDNEEKGLLGSKFFGKKHKTKNKCLVNFDCVGEGEHIFFVCTKKTDKKYTEAIHSAFPTNDKYSKHVIKGGFFAFPSDQIHFKNGIGISTVKKCKIGGYYVGRLHTRKDTILEEENVAFLKKWACELANQ